ncbi:LysM peptidoglycan-binding domain-containing protein [Sulfitobacter aestuarii]|uniref:LysM peptidoglycan-binding domain-containing protein n=1 Tax=Sulfitobacter aestuarii TaxID=2161676 RepID=A0ABW5U1D3_9RHOB
MAISASGIRSAPMLLGATGLAITALALWAFLPRSPLNEAPDRAAQLPDTTARPEADVGQPTAQATPDTPSVSAPPKLPAPAFDEVRREPDGLTVIAGRAAPGARIELLQDGAPVGAAQADAQGRFAAVAQLPSDGQGHVLSLTQELDGERIASQDDIILAPSKAAPEQSVELAEAIPAEQHPDARTEHPATQTAEAPPADTASPATTAAEADPSDSAPPTVTASTQPGEATEPDAPVALLKSTPDGIEVMQPAAPQVMSRVALDAISYADSGEVQLAGRAQPEARHVRIYLDNDAVIDLAVDNSGRWRGELPQVDAGIYTLRVDEMGASGDVISRVETPFKRESAAALAAAGAGQDGPLSAVTVQRGDTLWAISRARYGDGLLFVRVFEANSTAIRNPDLIYPGQVFDLPD